MMTSKERAELRAQANPLDVTLIGGKGGISDTLLAFIPTVIIQLYKVMKEHVHA